MNTPHAADSLQELESSFRATVSYLQDCQIITEAQFKQYIQLVQRIQKCHQKNKTMETRKLFRECLRYFIKEFAQFGNTRQYVKIAFVYVRMFQDPTQILQYLKSHLVTPNEELTVQEALYWFYYQKDSEKALKVIDEYPD